MHTLICQSLTRLYDLVLICLVDQLLVPFDIYFSTKLFISVKPESNMRATDSTKVSQEASTRLRLLLTHVWLNVDGLSASPHERDTCCTWFSDQCLTPTGIIPLSASDVSEQYEVFITPIGWAFAIWGVIYIWLGVALVYGRFVNI